MKKRKGRKWAVLIPLSLLIIILIIIFTAVSWHQSTGGILSGSCKVQISSPLAIGSDLEMAVGEETVITARYEDCPPATIHLGLPPHAIARGEREKQIQGTGKWSTSVMAVSPGSGVITLLVEREGEPIARAVLRLCTARTRDQIPQECERDTE